MLALLLEEEVLLLFFDLIVSLEGCPGSAFDCLGLFLGAFFLFDGDEDDLAVFNVHTKSS